MATRFSIEAVFKAVDRMTAPITKIQNRLRKFTRMASNGFRRLNRTVDRTIAKLKRAGLAVVGVATSFGFALAKISKPGIEFGRSIGTAAIKFGEGIERNSDQFKALEKSARNVGRTTEFTSTQAAEGLRLFAQAGFSSKQAMGALGDTVNFATANTVSLEDATSFATSALGQFGLGSKNAEKNQAGMVKVMDVMTRSANAGNLTVTDLSESLKFVGSIAKTTGSNIEFVGGAVSFLANRGIRGTSAGTSLKNMFLSLSGQAFKSGKVLRRLGIDTAEANGDLRNQADVLNELRIALNKMTEQKRIGAIKDIFGQIALPGVSAILDDTTGELDGLIKKMEGAAGTTGRFASFIRGDVKGSLDTLISSIESVAISIFKINETSFKELLESMTKWVRANEKVIATNIGEFLLKIGNNIGTIVEWIKNIAKGLAVFFAFSIVIKALTAAFVLFNIVATANPIGLIVVGVAALIAGITALIFWWSEIKKSFLDNAFIKGTVKVFSGLGKILDGVTDLFTDMPAWLQIAGVALVTLLNPIAGIALGGTLIIKQWDKVKSFFMGLKEDLIIIFQFIGNALDDALKKVSAGLTSLENRFEFVRDTADFFKGAEASEFKQDLNRVASEGIERIGDELKGLGPKIKEGLRGIPGSGGKKIREGIEGLLGIDINRRKTFTPGLPSAPLGQSIDPGALQSAVRGEAAPNVVPFSRPQATERTEVTIKAEAGTEVTNVKGATTKTGVKVINSGGG